MYQGAEWHPPNGTGHPGSQRLLLYLSLGLQPAPGFSNESLEPGHAAHTLPAPAFAEVASEEPHRCDSPAGPGSGKAGDWSPDSAGSEIGLLSSWLELYPHL